MSEKRKREEGSKPPVDYRPGAKKLKKGFTVGPANLPDGVYKRKTQKIKAGLIQSAQIKKNYAKLQRQGKVPTEPERLPQPASLQAEAPQAEAHSQPETIQPDPQPAEPNSAPHPDRQTLIEKAENEPEASPEPPPRDLAPRHRRKPKSPPFKREHHQAQQRKAEAEERRKAYEEAERQRRLRIEERERFRRAMAKARTGGPNGQRKLGRESKVLLERVKRMVGDGG